MIEAFVTIKEVSLNNHCPICYSKEGLWVTFKQKTVENSFYKSVTSEINHDMVCKNCNSIIYPINWTEDMERVFDYQIKAVTPRKSSTHLKKASWLAILSGVLIAICIVVILIYVKL